MKFIITEKEAREMAAFEESVGCDISAGLDWGIHLGKVLEFVLNQDNTNNSLTNDQISDSEQDEIVTED